MMTFRDVLAMMCCISNRKRWTQRWNIQSINFKNRTAIANCPTTTITVMILDYAERLQCEVCCQA